MTASIGFEVELSEPYDQALERVQAALADEGFGVLTRIDVRETFKKKLDLDFRPYSILGACNPKLASRALGDRPEAGLLLPCNVTVESAEGGGSLVRIVDPEKMMQAGGMEDDAVLAEVGQEARERLSRVAEALGAAGA
jgi:uncharacterized protein (DUF302 family)